MKAFKYSGGVPSKEAPLDPRIEQDPRLTQHQIRAIKKLWAVDKNAYVSGLDTKFRPIVSCRIAGKPTRYALLRNGDPATPEKHLEIW